jgi:hypothetical protein
MDLWSFMVQPALTSHICTTAAPPLPHLHHDCARPPGLVRGALRQAAAPTGRTERPAVIFVPQRLHEPH